MANNSNQKKNGWGVGEVCVVWASGVVGGGGLVVSKYFDKESNFFSRETYFSIN